MIINKSTKTSRICKSPFAKLGRVIVNPCRYYSSVSNSKENRSLYFDRNLRDNYREIIGGKGNYLIDKNGVKIFDAATGAAVSCLGYGNKRVAKVINKQFKIGTPYLASSF